MATHSSSASPVRRNARNSSVELLRILAMLMIVASHCVMFTDLNVLEAPLGINKILIETFLYSGGKIGVVVFFTISAWYLSEIGGVKANLRRVWILEREMLFWSLTLLAVTGIVDRSQLGVGLAVGSVFPAVTALWWYPTAYAVFLLFFPFLSQGLRALDKTMHGALCLVMITLWTVLDMAMPMSAVGLPGGDYLSFIYIYVLVMYYRWHMRPMRIGSAWWMLIGGYTLIVFGAIGGGLLYGATGRLEVLQVYLGKVEFRLPVLMAGLAMFVLFERREFRSAAVNMVAGSTFGVYLISEYPTVRRMLWTNDLVDWTTVMSKPWAIPAIIAAACAAFVGCMVLDRIRGLLFAVTVDRNTGAWFDKVWSIAGNAVKPHLRNVQEQ